MKILIILILSCAMFCHAGENTNSAPNPSTNLTNHQDNVFVSESPSDADTQLEISLGLWKRQLAVKYPSSMKLTVMCRVYRNGVLDKMLSSRQVHGTTMPIGTEFFQLGMIDPDAINPGKSQGKVKIFGSLGPLWINKAPQGSSSGCTISIPTTGEIESGKEQLLMELRYGTAILVGSSATYLSTNSEFRVTLHIHADPLNAQEQQILLHQSNFNEAFKVDDWRSNTALN
jgi:hypothetical protein